MSTRCFIGIINDDRSVDYIYCHHDGDTESVGFSLATVYSKYTGEKVEDLEQKVRNLIAKGSRSSLMTEDENLTVYEDEPAQKKDLAEFVNNWWKSDCEYAYLYDPHSGNWGVLTSHGLIAGNRHKAEDQVFKYGRGEHQIHLNYEEERELESNSVFGADYKKLYSLGTLMTIELRRSIEFFSSKPDYQKYFEGTKELLGSVIERGIVSQDLYDRCEEFEKKGLEFAVQGLKDLYEATENKIKEISAPIYAQMEQMDRQCDRFSLKDTAAFLRKNIRAAGIKDISVRSNPSYGYIYVESQREVNNQEAKLIKVEINKIIEANKRYSLVYRELQERRMKKINPDEHFQHFDIEHIQNDVKVSQEQIEEIENDQKPDLFAGITPESKVKAVLCADPDHDPELGELDPALSFADVLECMGEGKNIYDLFSISESYIREQVFTGLSAVYKCEYNQIYDLWLEGYGHPDKAKELYGNILSQYNSITKDREKSDVVNVTGNKPQSFEEIMANDPYHLLDNVGDEPLERENRRKSKQSDLVMDYLTGGNPPEITPKNLPENEVYDESESLTPFAEHDQLDNFRNNLDVIFMEASLKEPTLNQYGEYIRDYGVWAVDKDNLKLPEFKSLLKYKSCYATLEDVDNNKYMSFDDKRELAGEKRRYNGR